MYIFLSYQLKILNYLIANIIIWLLIFCSKEDYLLVEQHQGEMNLKITKC